MEQVEGRKFNGNSEGDASLLMWEEIKRIVPVVEDLRDWKNQAMGAIYTLVALGVVNGLVGVIGLFR